MILRQLSKGNAGQIFDAFCSVSVSEAQKRKPGYGFYEYPLRQEDIDYRLDLSREANLGIGLFGGKRELLAYVLAYPFSFGRSLNDEVLKNVDVRGNAVYLDQLFMKPGLPAFLAGRLSDYWTELAKAQKFSGVFCAIPQNPWENVASTRFAIHRGFRRRGVVHAEKTDLGIFTKPFWELGDVPRDLYVEINERGAFRG